MKNPIVSRPPATPGSPYPLAAVLLAATLAVTSAACTGDTERSETATETGSPAAAAVVVPAEGQRFDPPVSADQIPEGAWYCDMGTVHFARQERGKSVCPVCKMALVEKKPAESPAAESDDGGADAEGGKAAVDAHTDAGQSAPTSRADADQRGSTFRAEC